MKGRRWWGIYMPLSTRLHWTLVWRRWVDGQWQWRRVGSVVSSSQSTTEHSLYCNIYQIAYHISFIRFVEETTPCDPKPCLNRGTCEIVDDCSKSKSPKCKSSGGKSKRSGCRDYSDPPAEGVSGSLAKERETRMRMTIHASVIRLHWRPMWRRLVDGQWQWRRLYPLYFLSNWIQHTVGFFWG